MKTIIELTNILTQYEDAESAIAVYKEANLAIAEYEKIKQAALELAQHSLEETGETGLKTLVGSCGWTMPKTPQLDKEAWRQATLSDAELWNVDNEFAMAESRLKGYQQSFMVLPPKRFYIR